MFTGIIDKVGKLIQIEQNASNISFFVESAISNELRVDQSVSHNGVCLTVESIDGNVHKVTAIQETLLKTNLAQLQIGGSINLERCMLLNSRLDGHIVQGHVDAVATCTNVIDKGGSWEYSFEFDKKFAALIIEKGSICVNGISLTAFNITNTSFTVAIIPYTFNNTNMQNIQIGDIVNIEFDVLGKYILRSKQIEDLS
jgi:riboflavin synthase